KYGLDTVMKTTPRSYTMKGSNLPQVGFIAQELKPLIPEVVDGTDGSMGISYGNLVAVAFQAIKELNQKVTDLQTQMKDFVFDKLTAKIAYIDQIDVKKLNAVDANFSGVANFNNDARFAGNVCVDNVCVSKDKFKELLLNSGGVTYGSAADQMKGINPLDNQATPTVTTPAATTTTTIETTEATTTPIVIPVVETTEATSTTTIVPTPVETPTTPEPVPIPVQASEPVVTSTPPSTTETASTTNTTN
ncbi:MAG: tail fiber domain-containing protein, partial [Candidatus Taylorbacteria bacterium]|nr:tail fiber domain-containing protein [Candidatus Taylorbacteria bacterium]